MGGTGTSWTDGEVEGVVATLHVQLLAGSNRGRGGMITPFKTLALIHR